MRAIVRYVMERFKWELAGKPMRSAERVRQIYHEICKPCPHFGGTLCNVCGCNIRDSLEKPAFNKLAWSTTHCPLNPPKWTEDVKPIIDLAQAQKLAEEEVARMEQPPQINVSVQAPPKKPTGCCGP